MRCSARRNAGFLQQRDGARARFVGVDRQMRLDRLDELPADRVERVQRGQRVLEDRADLAAADLAHRLVRQVVDALALEPDLAAGDAARRLEQADDRGAGERLAGARLADHAQHLAGRDVEGDVVERQQRAAPRREFDAQVASLRAAARTWRCAPQPQRSFGFSASRSQSPSRLTDSAISTSISAGEDGDPPLAGEQEVVADADQRAERGRVGGTPTPRNDSVASVMIALRDLDRRDHQHRPEHVGQHVAGA